MRVEECWIEPNCRLKQTQCPIGVTTLLIDHSTQVENFSVFTVKLLKILKLITRRRVIILRYQSPDTIESGP